MNQSLIVRGAPQEYECCEGAWEKLEAHLQKRKIKRTLILHGEKSWAVAKNYFPKLDAIESQFIAYGGECTDQRVGEVLRIVQEKNMEGIVAVGGGKVSDLGKAVAYQAGIPILILPTLASTCAAYTPLSVMYHSDGSMDRYDMFAVSNALVLIEPKVILTSPVNLMVAGIGDTLAKWYEADAMISQLETQSIEIQVAAYAAKRCQQVLLANGQQALEAMKQQQINQAFLDVVETNILLGGMVGGFGDDYGRTSGAHSIHDALTILPKSHKQLHGNKVAYGILIQLVIENKWEEIERLLPFYQNLRLPTCLADMHLYLTEEEYDTVAKRAVRPSETIHYMKEKITAKTVKQAMIALEDRQTEKMKNKS